jgi:hypothetical protein
MNDIVELRSIKMLSLSGTQKYTDFLFIYNQNGKTGLFFNKRCQKTSKLYIDKSKRF